MRDVNASHMVGIFLLRSGGEFRTKSWGLFQGEREGEGGISAHLGSGVVERKRIKKNLFSSNIIDNYLVPSR